MWALRCAMFLILLGCGIVWTYAGIWMKQQGAGETFIGLLIGAGSALSAAAGLFWGWLADRTAGATPVAAAGCLLTAVALLVLAVSHSAAGFCLYQMLVSTGMAATLSIMPVLALALIGEERPGSGYANFRIFGSLGYIVGLFVLASLVRDLAHVLLASSVLLASAIAPLMLANVETRGHVRHYGISALVRRPGLPGMLAAVFFYAMGVPAVFTFLALYAHRIGMDNAAVGRLMGMCGVVALPGLPLMGLAADRLGARLVLGAGFVALPVRILLQAAASGPTGLFAAQLLHLLTWAGPEVTAYTFVTRLAGRRDRAVAVSGLVTARTLGQLAGNPLCGWLAERAGYRTMFAVMAAVSFFGFLLFILLVPPPESHVDETRTIEGGDSES